MERNITNKKGMDKKSILAILIGFISLVLLFAVSFSENEEQQSEKNKTQPSDSTIVGSESWKESQIRRFKEDSVMIKNYDYKTIAESDIPKMRESIKQLKRFISGGLENISQTEFYENDKRVSIPLNFIKKESQKILDKAFPLYRKRFTLIMNKRLWEEDIDVEVTGKGNTVLWFTAGRFASNKQIKQFQELITNEVKTFEFKRTCYKWIKSDDEYTYYDL